MNPIEQLRNNVNLKKARRNLTLLVGIITTGTLGACKSNDTYPQSGIYEGPTIEGMVNWDTWDKRECSLSDGQPVTITGNESTIPNSTVTETIIDGQTCWLQATLRKITRRTN